MRKFFEQFIEPEVRRPDGPSEHAIQVVTAALMLEMMRMDDEITAAERDAVTAALRAKFSLTDAEIGNLVALAEKEARQAPGYHPFTSLINHGFNAAQKVQIVELMWQVAYADGHLDSHEQHFLRKIAGLLYVPHADYIAAKLRARSAMDVPTGSRNS